MTLDPQMPGRIPLATATATDSGHELPPEIRTAIAVANATSIGLQPALLANAAAARQIFELILTLQRDLETEQARAQLRLAAVAKLAECILVIDPTSDTAARHVASTLAMFDAWAAGVEDDHQLKVS